MTLYSEEIVQKARRLRKLDLSYREIGRTLGVSDNLIGKWCFGIGSGKGNSLGKVKRNNLLREKIIQKDKNLIKRKKIREN
jgi:hypothetical protein